MKYLLCYHAVLRLYQEIFFIIDFKTDGTSVTASVCSAQLRYEQQYSKLHVRINIHIIVFST